MRKSINKLKFIFPLILLCIILSTEVQAESLESYTDHWAYQYMLDAYNQGWYQFSSEFDPDAKVTRADFLCILQKAIKLIPGEETSEFLAQASTISGEYLFTDTSDHWISTEGWLQTALNFGIVMPVDYPNHTFKPNSPMARRECILMIDRALGRVYPATTYVIGPNHFTDFAALPGWFKGFAHEAANNNLVIGYPDGSLKADNDITVAEAITAISRTMAEMNQGIDNNISVTVIESNGDDSILLDMTVPVQIIDDKIFLPVRLIYEAGRQLHDAGENIFIWRPSDQILEFDYVETIQFESGINHYGYGEELLPAESTSNELSADVRILRGEIMVPVISSGRPENIKHTNAITWNPMTKNLIIAIGNP